MEPMTLGSPSGSPAAGQNTSSFLPNFLMGGEVHTPTQTRSTLSPNKNRSVSFANTPTTPAQDYNRILGQKTLFGGSAASSGQLNATPMQGHNASISGPPTQGLFDTLRTNTMQQQQQTSVVNNSLGFCEPPSPHTQNISAFGVSNQSYQQQQAATPLHLQQLQQSAHFNDSYLSNASFNVSNAILSPPLRPNPLNMTSTAQYATPTSRSSGDFWVTVFGFPTSAASSILLHFTQCGTIVDKVFPSQNGNWVHLRYSSVMECDRALNYNERILNNNIMVGVTRCKDANVFRDKENICTQERSNIRPMLGSSRFTSSEANISELFANNSNAPQKSSGIMDKALDLIFGW